MCMVHVRACKVKVALFRRSPKLSRKVILRCGGVLENHARDEDGVPIDRFWIENA